MKNRYHRYLKLPFKISKPEMFNEFPNEMKHFDINEHYDINVDKWLDSLGLHAGHTEVFYTPPNGGKLPIHSDETTLDDHVKINITWGPKEGVMRWWEAKKTQVFTDIEDVKENYKDVEVSAADEFSHRQHTNVLAEEKDCTLLYEVNTNRPSLVNVGMLHSTYNPTNQGRWTLCFVPAVKGGHGYIYWDEAQKYFKDFIIGEN